MLKKLIKHEYKATWRYFIPMYIGLAIVTALACGFIAVADYLNTTLVAIGGSFGLLIGILGMIFVFMSPYIFLTLRFYKTTATREAYLTFTVPADTKSILFAKFIVGYIWTIVTMVLAYIAICLVIYTGGGEEFVDIMKSIFEVVDAPIAIVSVLTFLLSLANSLLSIYASVSMAQLVRDHRVIASFGFYAAIYTVQQVVSVVATIPYLIKEIGSATEEVVQYSATTSIYTNEDMGVLIVSLVLTVLFSVAEAWICHHFLNKKLNLL